MSDPTVVCDLDGVVYIGDRAIDGAGDALTELHQAGVNVVFCTNNSSRTRRQIVEKIERVTGFSAEPTNVFSSAMAAAGLLGESSTALVVGGPGVHEALAERGIEAVSGGATCDAVVVGLDVDLTYRKLVDATLAVRSGARFVATNHDATFPSPEGLYPGGGAIVAALETATDVTAEVAGKPHQAMRDTIAAAIGSGEVWMVGDRPDTDMAMAAAAGWHGALVRTGVPNKGAGAGVELEVEDLTEFTRILLERR